MPGEVVGIQIDVSENASTAGPRVAEQLRRVGEAGKDAGEALQSAFDTTRAEAQLTSFADKIDKLYEMKFGREREMKLRYMELRNQQMEQRLVPKSGTPEENALNRIGVDRALMTTSRAGSTIAQIGHTGQAVQPAASILETITGAVSKAGPVGATIAAVGSMVAVGAVITDQLVRTYEPFISQLMDTTAAFGDLKNTTTENSLAFRESLRQAGESASQFGYSLEVGVDILNQLAKGGLGRGAAVASETQLLAYARGYGVSPGNLVGAQILAQRYGQGNVLGLAAGGTAFQGMGSGRYEEYLNAMTSIFEEAIGKGVSRGFEDISGTLNFFGRLGPMWQGQVGAQKIGTLNQAVSGATGLQSETDVLLYRAAKQQAQGAGSYIDVMMELEKGVTVGLFQNVYEQIKQMTGGSKTDMVELLRQTFGINYSMASQLYEAGLPGTGADLDKLIAQLPPPSAESDEMQLVRAENELKLAIIEAGESLLGAKVDLVNSANDVVKWLSAVAGTSYTAQVQKAEDKKVELAASEFAQDYYDKFLEWVQGASATSGGSTLLDLLGSVGVTGATGAMSRMMDPQYITRSGMSEAQYLLQQQAMMGLVGGIGGLNESQMALLAGKSSQVRGAVSGIGNKDWTLQPEEMLDFYNQFKPILDEVVKESIQMTSAMYSTGRVGTIEALSKYTELQPGESSYSLQAGGRYGLESILAGLQKLQAPRATGFFGIGGESEQAYNQRMEKAKRLEDVLTGLTTGQLEALISTGTLGTMYSKQQLSTADVDALIQALRENTAALNAPATVMVQGKE
jgi:hypothetical protein